MDEKRRRIKGVQSNSRVECTHSNALATFQLKHGVVQKPLSIEKQRDYNTTAAEKDHKNISMTGSIRSYLP
jgi:hypothetical protein